MSYCYSVRAVLPDDVVRREYLSWLRSGHVHAVLAGGARAARIILDDARPLEIVTQYDFADHAAFQVYERESAPALRAEGVARFGSRASFTRSGGECVEARPGASWAS